MLLLVACEKRYCWDCKTTTVVVVTPPAHDTIRTNEDKYEEICDKSEGEINLLSEDRTGQFIRQIAR